MSKLYTEEQVNILCQALAEIYQCDESDIAIYALSHFEKLNPIELPTDEEIKEEVSKLKFSKEGYRGGVIEGMIWMRDKISTTKLTETK